GVGVADEPGVAVVLGGAGLAGRRTADLGGDRGAVGDHALEHVVDLIGERRRDALLALVVRVVEHLLAVPDDLVDEPRLVVDAHVGEGGGGAGHGDGGEVGGRAGGGGG